MSPEVPLTLTVRAEAAGVRLDRFLAGPLGSRARAQMMIDAGLVSVDGERRSKRFSLTVGETVTVQARVVQRARADVSPAPYAIAYEDEHLLVVDKPAGVVVHPARGHREGTLSQALAGRAAGGEDPWRAGIVHRLDRDTSGLLVVAKRDDVHRALKELLASRELRREYLALVTGHPSARTGSIDAPIGRDRRDRLRISLDSDAPREARTHFEIEQLLPTSTLLRVRLETGRTHQIRVHLSAIGHPVCGDPQYGTRDELGLQRQFLHAARLAFTHPVTERSVDVSSPLPADLEAALARARAG